MDGAAIPQYDQVKLPNSIIVKRFFDTISLNEVFILSNPQRGKSGVGCPKGGLSSNLIQGLKLLGINES